MQPLPPEAVAGIDQRAGECTVMLDKLIERYQMIAASHGNAAAVQLTASAVYETQIRGIGNVIDVLAFAVARIVEAETPQSPELENT